MPAEPLRWAIAIAVSLGLFALSTAIAPYLPLDPTQSAVAARVGYGLSFAAVATCVLGVAASTPSLGRAAIAIVAIAAVGLVALSPEAPRTLGAAAVLALLLAAGTSLGALVGSRIQHPGHLLAVAAISSLADLVSVATPGAPSDVVAATPALLSILAISWPMPGTHDLVAILGVGDVAFVALYFAAARTHRLSWGRTAIALAVGLATTALVVMVTSLAIPALPFLGAAMLVAHPAARWLPPSDRRPAAIGLAIVVLALAALVLFR